MQADVVSRCEVCGAEEYRDGGGADVFTVEPCEGSGSVELCDSCFETACEEVDGLDASDVQPLEAFVRLYKWVRSSSVDAMAQECRAAKAQELVEQAARLLADLRPDYAVGLAETLLGGVTDDATLRELAGASIERAKKGREARVATEAEAAVLVEECNAGDPLPMGWRWVVWAPELDNPADVTLYANCQLDPAGDFHAEIENGFVRTSWATLMESAIFSYC